jgi:hypothetical protein
MMKAQTSRSIQEYVLKLTKYDEQLLEKLGMLTTSTFLFYMPESTMVNSISKQRILELQKQH